jgi:hypothetical protein
LRKFIKEKLFGNSGLAGSCFTIEKSANIVGEEDVHDAVVPVGVCCGDEDLVELGFLGDSILDLVFPIKPASFFEGIMAFEQGTVR